MRVAFVSDKSSPFFTGGYESRVWNLARRLALSHEVKVFTSIPESHIDLEGVRFEKVSPYNLAHRRRDSRSFLHGLIYAGALSRDFFRRWNPEAVYFEAIPYVHLPALSTWIPRIDAVKILNINEAWYDYSSISTRVDRLALPVIRRSLRAGLSWADHSVAISGSTALSLREHYSPQKLSVIPMGVESIELKEGPLASPMEREIDFVSVSRLVSIKRTEDFIDSLARLQEKHQWKGKAVIGGSGPKSAELRQRVDLARLRERVWFTGYLPEKEKFEILSRSKCFVLTSEREGFSEVTLEAMACGAIPVVAVPKSPEVFGVGDFVKDGQNGLYFPVANAEQLGETLWRLINSPVTMIELSLRARETARLFTWERAANMLERLVTS